MKALVCAACHDIKALNPDGSWAGCRCGHVRARWIDPRLGTAEFTGHYPSAFLLGLNNQMFGPALRGETSLFSEAAALHDVATDAPNHIFDKSRAACWAVIVKPGRTNDVTWTVPE